MQSLPFYPQGFRSCAKSVGIRDTTLDFTVIASDVPAAAAAMFTQSRFCGPAITVGREHVANGQLQAFVINSKNANVATGEQGLANIREVARRVAEELHIAAEDILPSSTGVIGWQLPMENLRAGIAGIAAEMRPGRLHVSAHAIMTTDTRPKMRARRIGDAVLVGMCKGVGMIEPNMATMLAYFVTDARIAQDYLKQCLQEVVNLTFNMISVDTDTSTSDTVAIMANGLAGDVPLADFRQVLLEMATDLARDLASDGEGATKLLEVTVSQAASFEQAKTVAKSIVNSPLVKTAIFGTDPNWGRVAMAIGKCHQYTDILPENVSISFGDLLVYQGQPLGQENLPQLEAYLHNTEVAIYVSLGTGEARATVWGCDLSYEYVKINGEYTT
ncbi:arginine biosynthesis bifunctional protein ArgJ 2 [Dictyobacter vulcani]|uniref:Arginine biosynthesis bifunctional protein ArgJ n=1 Tax=Dictyobacter vulcani TaxID=2607529 RepID=A0A5J4KGR2_9CHLR|nr:bifunctional glutamate N-acetyltransferase/amino-acid acetyltransferase ArgJ [Dictyobacter vulcani]GER86903.1 arginine biosynthesis bifunctional protein ArgJ 2 [Dictyobacter vulcani]